MWVYIDYSYLRDAVPYTNGGVLAVNNSGNCYRINFNNNSIAYFAGNG
ncbi:hypothetical protein CCP3SC1AL1_680011 [Gammaproteobacteria bacterium]